jgi:hypothetical protein
MIRDIKSLEQFYIVKSSNLECIVLANSFEEAVNMGIKKILKSHGKNTNLSFLISVDKIDEIDIETRIFETVVVLADLGLFKLAEDFRRMSDFFLDKGKNPH